MKHEIQKINWLGIVLYMVFAALAVFCVISPIFCIMPKLFALCVVASGAFTILGMFFNRRALYDTLKYTIEIPDDVEPAEEPTETVIVEELPKPKAKKTTKKKKGDN